jgi:UDP-2,4-diacetamido-2,4,6-trideoxy-beta-L-altropyranose hydrolase
MLGTLLIRADAGATIGTGHWMRSLALARAWQAAGGQAAFLGRCSDRRLRERITAAEMAFHSIDRPHPDPNDLVTTLATIARLRSESPETAAFWTVLDGYHFDAAYQEAVAQTNSRLLVIDDLAHLPRYHADLLVNQNHGAERLVYPADARTGLLLGARYALLRPEFLARSGSPKPIAGVARKILITLGGADPPNASLLAIRAFARMGVPDAEGKLVVGDANPRAGELQAEIDRLKVNVRILARVADMSEPMAWADVALSAAGSTCWEMALMGLPAALLVLVDNQLAVAEPLAAAGAALNLGRAAELTPQALAESLTILCRNPQQRRRQSEAGRRLIDGRGARRVVAVMRALDEPFSLHAFRLRPVGPDDMLAIWRLANDPAVRSRSLSTESIPLEDHARWFAGKLASRDTRIWVFDLEGLVAAQIRYDLVEPELAEISFVVAAPFRGRGLGSRLLDATRVPAAEQLGAARLRAIVRRENAASMRVFQKAGFRLAASKTIQGHACQIFEIRGQPPI